MEKAHHMIDQHYMCQILRVNAVEGKLLKEVQSIYVANSMFLCFMFQST